MFQDKKSKIRVMRDYNIGIAEIVIGAFFGFIFGLTSLSLVIDLFMQSEVFELDTFIVISIIFFANIYLIINGICRIQLVKQYRIYIPFLNNSPIHFLD